MDFFVSSVTGRTASSVILVFVTGERCACKKSAREVSVSHKWSE